MKHITQKELKSLLETREFKSWWERFEKSVVEYEWAIKLRDELLAQNNLLQFRSELASKNAIDLLYKAGEYEDKASELLADASTIDNQSFEALGNFEEQRMKVSELWYRLGALEQSVEEHKERISELTKKLEATTNKALQSSIKSDIARLKDEGGRQNKQVKKLAETYEKESSRKTRMWEEVKRLWDKLLEINMAINEKQQKAIREKRTSEELFKQSEINKQRAARLAEEIAEADRKKLELEQGIIDLYQEAKQKFNCIAEEEFMYWPKRDSNSVVYCVPLIDNSDGYNMEIEKLKIYQVNRQQGVRFIEPVVEEAGIGSEDRRMEEFFTDRQGEEGSDTKSDLEGDEETMEKSELDKRAVLEGSRLFENLLHEELEMLSNLAVERHFMEGDILFNQGDTGNSLYVLVEGEVEVLIKKGSDEPKTIATIKAPEFFGEMSLIDKEERSATIRAKSDAVCLMLSTQNLHSFAKVYKNGFTMIVINIARVMSQRLRLTNKKLADAL